MAGIYIHIPFCRHACNYCDFHFSTNLKSKPELISSIAKELKSRSSYLNTEQIETLYFGGGTPSLLSESEWKLVLDAIHTNFSLSKNLEFTVEANPEDLNNANLKLLKRLGVNRLSIGVQSFFDEELKFMNRHHSSEEAILAIKNAQSLGIENLNIDLIFGSPNSSFKQWKKNVTKFFELNIPHLSAYSLTVEDKTKLHHQIKHGLVKELDDGQAFLQYEYLQNSIDQNGFIQYELSNYCLPGHESKHNSSYWSGEKYLGVGPSAHSFNGTSRQWNTRNNALYIKAIHTDSPHYEIELLNPKDVYHEYLITSLRTAKGLNIPEFERSLNPEILSQFRHKLSLISPLKINDLDNYLSVKREFLFQSDEIIRALWLD